MLKAVYAVLLIALILALPACGTGTPAPSAPVMTASPEAYESTEGRQVRMTADGVEVIITLNDSRAAADFAGMLPLELTLIERESFAKGMNLPRMLSTDEPATRTYQIGDFGYWAAGPDLAIFYDDIYEQTIVPVIPMGRAETGAEELRDASGTARLELIPNESEEVY